MVKTSPTPTAELEPEYDPELELTWVLLGLVLTWDPLGEALTWDTPPVLPDDWLTCVSDRRRALRGTRGWVHKWQRARHAWLRHA